MPRSQEGPTHCALPSAYHDWIGFWKLKIWSRRSYTHEFKKVLRHSYRDLIFYPDQFRVKVTCVKFIFPWGFIFIKLKNNVATHACFVSFQDENIDYIIRKIRKLLQFTFLLVCQTPIFDEKFRVERGREGVGEFLLLNYWQRSYLFNSLCHWSMW